MQMNMYKNYTRFFRMPNGYVAKLFLVVNSVFDWIQKTETKKWIMRVNLTAFLLFLSLLQVSAATFGQKVTLKAKDVSINTVFEEIRKQTGYSVMLKKSELNTSKKI